LNFFNYNTNADNYKIDNNFKKIPLTAKHKQSMNKARENKSLNLRNTNLYNNHNNNSYNNTVSYGFNSNKMDNVINNTVKERRSKSKNLISISENNQTFNTKPKIKNPKKIREKNNLIDENKNAFNTTVNKKSESLLNKNKNIDNIRRENELYEVKELIPKRHKSKQTFNEASILNRKEYKDDKNNKQLTGDKKLDLKDIFKKPANNQLDIVNFLNELTKRQSENIITNSSPIPVPLQIPDNFNNTSNNNVNNTFDLNKKSDFSDEIKKSNTINELDAKSYLSYLNANILKNNNLSEVNNLSNNNNAKSIDGSKEQMQDVFIKNKYKYLIENFKN
jgi:hypothetical protein